MATPKYYIIDNRDPQSDTAWRDALSGSAS
jgi:hypothetical protein